MGEGWEEEEEGGWEGGGGGGGGEGEGVKTFLLHYCYTHE